MLKILKENFITLLVILASVFIVCIGLKILFSVLSSKFFLTIIGAEIILFLILTLFYRLQK